MTLAATNPPRSIDGPAILFDPRRNESARRSARWRRLKNLAFRALCVATASASVLILLVLLAAITVTGLHYLDWQFLTSPPDTDVSRAGILPPLIGTVMLMLLCASFALPIGVASAILLEEYPPKNRLLKKAHGFVQLNIANLAGVPSVVYGIIGLTAFATMFGLFGGGNASAWEWGVRYRDQYFNEAYRVILVPAEGADAAPVPLVDGMSVGVEGGTLEPLNLIGPDAEYPADEALAARTLREGSEPGRIKEPAWYYLRLPFGRGLLTGALTLMLVILPVIIIATQEALRAVPDSLREGSLGMGATRWQTIRRITLPAAVPGIMTGSIIAMSRAIGEAAPLLMIAGIVFITDPPQNLMGDFTALPLQIYNWAQRPQTEFHDLAASGIIVLLVVLLSFNALAIYIRHRTHRPLS